MVTLFSNPVPVLILLGVSLVVYFAWALLPGFLAKSKGYSFWLFFLLGLLSPLILTIIVLCIKDNTSTACGDIVPVDDIVSDVAATEEVAPVGEVEHPTQAEVDE